MALSTVAGVEVVLVCLGVADVNLYAEYFGVLKTVAVCVCVCVHSILVNLYR